MTTFEDELENLEVEFLHGVPVKLPKETIQAIIELVDREKEKAMGEWSERLWKYGGLTQEEYESRVAKINAAIQRNLGVKNNETNK